MASVGQARDMFKKMDGALGLKGTVWRQFQDLYQNRCSLLHGTIPAQTITDGLLNIPELAGNEKTADKWHDESRWSDAGAMKFEVAPARLKDVFDELLTKTRAGLGECHKKIKEILCTHGARIEEIHTEFMFEQYIAKRPSIFLLSKPQNALKETVTSKAYNVRQPPPIHDTSHLIASTQLIRINTILQKLMPKVNRRFYFKLTNHGNLLGEYSNDMTSANLPESALRQPASSGTSFPGSYVSTWFEPTTKNSVAADLIVLSKPQTSGIFSLEWTGNNYGSTCHFKGEAMIHDGALIGNYWSC
jgi:hypothetical protein